MCVCIGVYVSVYRCSNFSGLIQLPTVKYLKNWTFSLKEEAALFSLVILRFARLGKSARLLYIYTVLYEAFRREGSRLWRNFCLRWPSVREAAWLLDVRCGRGRCAQFWLQGDTGFDGCAANGRVGIEVFLVMKMARVLYSTSCWCCMAYAVRALGASVYIKVVYLCIPKYIHVW